MGTGRGGGASYKKQRTENGRSLKLRAREAYFTLRAKTDISPASRGGEGGERSGKNLKMERNAPPPGLCSKQIDKYTRDGK